MTVLAPNRSVLQRQNALEIANAIRTYRCDLKKDIKAGKISVLSLLQNPPAEIENMKVIALLLAVPKLGQTKVSRMLYRHRISASKTVGGLSSRQRDVLISQMHR